MFKPKFFITLIVILLFWKPILSNRLLYRAITQRQIFHDDNIVSIYDLQGRPRTTNMENLDDLMGDHSYLVYSSIKCKYADAIVEILQTFFEINEYGLNAPIDIQIPNIKVITKKWLTSSINHLHSIKPPIVKMIKKLFSYMFDYDEFRTSDPSLLKSLLSINLFLSYSMNDGSFHYEATNEQESIQFIINDNDFENFLQNVRKLNSSIIQMIGFVERFRNKRCVVRNPYKNNHTIQKQISEFLTPIILSVNNLMTLLDKTWKNLHLLVNDESDDYSNFNSEIFDYKYLLFNQFLQDNNSFFNNVNTELFGSEFDLLSKYNVVKKTYSIEKILEFQYSLIDVIAEIFYAQIYNIVTQPNVNMNDISTLKKLDENFDCFIKLFMPKSCSINVCHNIIKNRYFLHDVNRNNDNFSLSEMVALLKIKFKPNETKKRVFYEIIRIEFADDQSLSSLLHNLKVNSRNNVSFKTVFDLLSYESHTNGDFDIVKKYEFTGVTQSQSFDTDFVMSLIELQCTLFTFRSILKASDGFNTAKHNLNYSSFDLNDYFKNKFTSVENANNDSGGQWHQVHIKAFEKYETNFANMLSVITRMYDYYFNNLDIRNILLPLMIRFRHADKNDCQKYDYDFLVMFQSSFVTITLIENYLIKNNLFPFYSLFVYSKLMVYDENKENISYFYNRISIYLQSEVQLTPFSNSVKRVRSLYDSPTYTTLFRAHDEEIEYFWNGQWLIGHKILNNFQWGVIDFNEIISFQWFGVKFLVGKILLRISNALSLLLNKTKSQMINEINVITIKLTRMLELKLPMSLRTFLKSMVDATNKLLDATDVFESDHCDQWQELYEESFEALGLTLEPENSTRFSSINEIITVIDSELMNLQIFLEIPFLGAKNILNLSELILSPTFYMYPEDSIRMLYNCNDS